MYVYQEYNKEGFGQIPGLIGLAAATVELSTASVRSVFSTQDVKKVGSAQLKSTQAIDANQIQTQQQSLLSQSQMEAVNAQQAQIDSQNMQKEFILGAKITVGLIILTFGVLFFINR